jgi:hypothetical protein
MRQTEPLKPRTHHVAYESPPQGPGLRVYFPKLALLSGANRTAGEVRLGRAPVFRYSEIDGVAEPDHHQGEKSMRWISHYGRSEECG